MMATRYVHADVAITGTINNADGPKVNKVPQRSKWPAVRRVLGKPKPKTPAHGVEPFQLELQTQDYHTNLIPFYHCFNDKEYLVKLLYDLSRKDSELATYLEAQHLDRSPGAVTQTLDEEREISFEASGTSSAVSVNGYVDFLSAFVSLFAQSHFLSNYRDIDPTQDPHGVVSSLANRQCPEDMLIFRRVSVSPHYVVKELAEGDAPELYKGIPVVHLAKFLDVAVVRFLSTVTEHTSTRSVIWALDYLSRLLSKLHNSLISLTSFGWYGAPPIRGRKGTTTSRPSVTRPVFVSSMVPPMVVVGTPPTSPPASYELSSRLGPSSLVLDPETGQHSPHPSPNFGNGSPNFSSRGSSPSSSPRHERRASSPSSPHMRAVSPLSNATRTSSSFLASSVELHPQGAPTHPQSTTGRTQGLTSSQESNTSSRRRINRQEHSMDSTEMAYFDNIQSEVGQPVLFTGPSPESLLDSDLHVRSTRADSRARSPRGNSPPLLSSIQEDSIQEDYESLQKDEESASESVPRGSLSPKATPSDEEVRPKDTSPDVPQVDLQNELDTALNGEGRISLIAILDAISRLPQSEVLWTAEVGEKCFSLIQICLDLGLPPKHHNTTSSGANAHDKRRKFQTQENLAFSKHGNDKPSTVHVRYIVEASVNALIQCATSLIVGCTSESSFCSLRHIHLPYQSNSFHSRLVRMLQRIDDRSPATFRQTLTNFAQPCKSTARKLFHFLHVVLQYCSGSNEMYGTNSLMVDIVVSVLRATVDRLVELDITERSIQNSVVSEACSFFHYARNVLSEDSLSLMHGVQHLHMYLHRIALSIILPPRPKVELPALSPNSPLKDAASPLIALRSFKPPRVGRGDSTPPTSGLTKAHKSSTLPVKKSSLVLKQPAIAKSVQVHHGLGARTRSGSLNLPSRPSESSPSTNVKAKSRPRKQHSLHSDIGKHGSRQSSSDSNDEPSPRLGPRSSGASENSLGNTSVFEDFSEWKGLRLDLLRSRIQRLVVLMNTSLPGTVPDSDMLASLIDLGDGKTVVARSMVLLECAMFVSKLRTTDLPSVWVIHNKEHNAHLMHSVSHNLTKWGEAIGDKLRVVELREREIKNRLRFATPEASSKEPMLEEEPVFPVEREQTSTSSEKTDEGNYQAISYAVKMSACMLLLEITRFLRDPPPQFCGWSVSQRSTPRVSSVFMDSERRPSINSANSTDTESVPGGYASLPAKDIFPREILGRFGSNLSVEDAEPPSFKHSTSIDESGGSTSPRKKRVSVYLRVNSTGGTMTRTSSLKRQSKFVRMLDSPGPSRSNIQIHPSPTIRSRREALTSSTVTALHQSLYTGHRGARRPSITGLAGSLTVGTYHPLPTKYRRKSVGAPLLKQASTDVERNIGVSEQSTTSTTSKTASTGSGLFGTSLGNLKNKARRAMHTLRRRPTKSRLQSESASSPAGSPGHRRRIVSSSGRRLSHAGSFSSQHGMLEDKSLQCSWLNIVEHLIVVESSSSPKVRCSHNLSCRGLITALKKIYSATFEEEEDIAIVNPSISRSLSLMFTQRVSQRPSDDVSSIGGPSYTRGTSLPDSMSRRRSQKASPAAPKRVSSVPGSGYSGKSLSLKSRDSSGVFSSLNFSRMSCEKFSGTFLGATEDGDESIEHFLEAESAYPQSYLDAELDNQRRDYVCSELLGLVHVPFSILVHAAPALHVSTLSHLKLLAWESLLEIDSELSHAAAAFFLLSCSKESSANIKGFVTEHVRKETHAKQRDAIQRFEVLWDTRYYVWPRMEEKAQKKMCLNDSKSPDSTIGYSLPANLLGQAGDNLPLSPWEPSSVCTNKTCEDNPNLCYRSTQHVSVIHGGEVSERVRDFSVAGVSLVQEASCKPANVFLVDIDDDDTGNIEKVEAVKTTLFPQSLLPLVRFVIMALTPHSTSPAQPHSSTSSQPLSSTSSQDTADSMTQTDRTELARQVVWKCMIEDEYLFFQPLLNQFNRLYILIKEKKSKTSADVEKLLAEILEPLHTLFQSFNSLPSRAAHFLFNNFIGVIMKHTDQPVVHSPRIIRSVLTLVGMVVPSVKGLDSKVLKSILKKENCYTTVMTTARIRGVEKVYVTGLGSMGQKLYAVPDEMTFGNLIAHVCERDRVSVDLLNNWCLFDAGKDVPVLSSLVIQDHYSAPLDSQYPNFVLKGATTSERLWSRQMDQLFVFKMNELMRVQFTTQLLHTGPEIEKGVAYSEYAQPNHRFIHNELVELNSFPRKALTSILQEAGQGGLQNVNLQASDIMLKGMWVKFILQLFKSVKPDYNWSNSMILFLNVINGSLLLHSENNTILRVCLASLLTAAAKFNSVFKRDGYQMIVPVLIQVYAMHMQNQLIKNALKFLWFHFYLLDGNTFISQMAASASTLFSENVASLSSKVSSNYAALPPNLPQMEGENATRYQVKAVFELMQALDLNAPTDSLDLRLYCQQCLDEVSFSRLIYNPDNYQRLSLQNAAALLITLATWMPGALRGMQVLVFIDHLVSHFLKGFSTTNPLSLLKSMEYLIKGSESITVTRRRGNISNRKGGGSSAPLEPQTPGLPVSKPFNLTDTNESAIDSKPAKPSFARKVSVALQQKFRILENPNKKGVAGNVSEVSLEQEGRVWEPSGTRAGVLGIDHGAINNQFTSRRQQYESQQILQLARDSLLSIATQFVIHHSKVSCGEWGLAKSTSVTIGRKTSNTATSGVNVKQERTKVALDASSVSLLTSIVIQLIKHGYTNETVLQGKGLVGFMTCLMPNIEWSEPYFSSFQNLLARFVKFFKYLQKESNKAMMVWESLTAFINGITTTIHKSPQLVQGHEQHLQKLKLLLESIVNLHHAGVGSTQHQSTSVIRKIKSIQTPLLRCAPVTFSEAVVGLAVELIVLTHASPQHRHRYHLSDLLCHKIMEEHEEILMAKIILPVCTQLGLRDDMAHPCVKDADFLLDHINKNVEVVLKLAQTLGPKIMSQKLPPENFFRVLEVVCCSFSETFALQHWHKISQWVIFLIQRKSIPTVSPKVSVTSTDSSSSAGRMARLSSISNSSQTGSSNSAVLESFLLFHECLLGFFESFLVMYQVPLLSMLWPVLKVQETQLQDALQGVKNDTPVLFERVNLCIDSCQNLLSSSFNSAASVSRHQLLQKINENLRSLALPTRVQLQRSHTSVEPTRPLKHSIKPRRSSYAAFTKSLSKIGEEEHESGALLQTATLPKKFKNQSVSSPEHRPKSLKFKGKSSSQAYVPPPVVTAKPSKSITLSESELSAGKSRRPKRRSPSPRRPQLNSSPEYGHQQKRHPKLKVIGRFGSSENYADIEDADESTSPDYKSKQVSGIPRLGVTNPVHDEEEYVFENFSSLSAENSPIPTKRLTPSEQRQSHVTLENIGEGEVLLVPVEVHENLTTTQEKDLSVESITEHVPLYSANSNESTTSESLLLSNSETESGRTRTRNGQKTESRSHKEADNDSIKDTDGLLEASSEPKAAPSPSSLSSATRRNSKQEKPTRKVSFSDNVTTSFSLDRKSSLSSALKESSKYLYRSLDDGKL